MAKNAPSKLTAAAPVAAASPAQQPASIREESSSTSTPAAVKSEDLRELLEEADADLGDRRPTAEQLAKDMLANPEDVALVRKALAIAEANQKRNSPITDGANLLAGAATDGGAPEAAAGAEETVRVYHLGNHRGAFVHGEHRLDLGSSAVVPASVAAIWASHRGPNGIELASTNPPGVTAGSTTAESRFAEEKTRLADENKSLADHVAGLEKLLAAAKASGFNPTQSK